MSCLCSYFAGFGTIPQSMHLLDFGALVCLRLGTCCGAVLMYGFCALWCGWVFCVMCWGVLWIDLI